MDNQKYIYLSEEPPLKKQKAITIVREEALLGIKDFFMGNNEELYEFYMNDYLQALEVLGINKDRELIIAVSTK